MELFKKEVVMKKLLFLATMVLSVFTMSADSYIGQAGSRRACKIACEQRGKYMSYYNNSGQCWCKK